jgi:putative transposase
MDRLFWTTLCRYWSRWKDVLIIVMPDTVTGWHRAGFRLYWRWRSRPRRPAKNHQRNPQSDSKPGGREPRLGSSQDPRRVAEARLRRVGTQCSPVSCAGWSAGGPCQKVACVPPEPPRSHRCHGLLHGADGDLPVALLLLRNRPRTPEGPSLQCDPPSDCGVGGPTAPRGLSRSGGPYRYVILDRDSKFDHEVITFLKSTGLQPKRTSVRAPWQNGIAERWVGSCRREILDHVIALNEQHLRRLIRDYVKYHHEDRTHDSLQKDTPNKRPVVQRPSASATVISMPRLGGLHHRYGWSEAA